MEDYPIFVLLFLAQAARVAFGLGIPHVTFSDSPHAQAVQKLTIPFVNYLLCPWIIPFSAWSNLGISRNQVVRYRALDPVAWIRKETKNIDSGKLKKKYQLSKTNTFVIRPEESKASYLIDKANNNVNNILKSIVQNFHDTTNILVLCRYQDQIRQFKENMAINHGIGKVVDGLELISVVISLLAGGTMTAESALLGKPTFQFPIKFYVMTIW